MFLSLFTIVNFFKLLGEFSVSSVSLCVGHVVCIRMSADTANTSCTAPIIKEL